MSSILISSAARQWLAAHATISAGSAADTGSSANFKQQTAPSIDCLDLVSVQRQRPCRWRFGRPRCEPKVVLIGRERLILYRARMSRSLAEPGANNLADRSLHRWRWRESEP